jgi:hypothetical protein
MGGHKNLEASKQRQVLTVLMPVSGPRPFLLPFEAGRIRLVPKRLMQEGEGLENLEPQAKEG